MKILLKISLILSALFAFLTAQADNKIPLWIGVSGEDLPLYSNYLPVFKINCDFEILPDGKGSLIYGANDPRLMDRNMNIYNLEGRKDSIGIKIEIVGDGTLNVYRYGYHPDDNMNMALASHRIPNLKKGLNNLSVTSNLGHTEIFINGEKICYIPINPIGNGGDYIAFPVLAEMAIEIPLEDKAKFSNLSVSNLRDPGNILYHSPDIYTETTSIILPVRSMPLLKTSIPVSDVNNLKSAIIDATARGIYDMYVNGERVSDDYFYPGSTQYNKTHLFHTFDIKPLLKSGENEILVQLAEGWWSGGATFTGENWNFYGDRQSFQAKASLEYANGQTETFVTSPLSWSYTIQSPLIEGSFFQGEIYDATNSDHTTFVWKPTVEIAIDSTVNKSIGSWDAINLRPSFGDRVKAVDTLQAISMTQPRPGVFIYDMGQNFAGVPEIDFNALKPGQEVTLRYAEVLYPDMPRYADNAGMIMTENIRAAMNKDIYRAAGKETETFSPRFTLHGFRYIEITGIDDPLPLSSVRGIPVSSIHKFNAHYECSDSLVNRLWENIKWSSLSNFISIPTDCPQRNERLGWMGDISVFAPTATKLADISPLIAQFLTSVRDCQLENGKFPDVAPTGFGFGGLLWGSAGITVPWEYYCQYGDLSLLKEHYPAMKKYIDYILNNTIDNETGIIVQDRAWGDLADWLSPEYDKTDKSLLWECYFIYNLAIMTDVAQLLGLTDDAREYEKLRLERIKFFKDNYVDKVTEKTIFSAFDPDRKGNVIDTQVSYVLPIAMGIYNSPQFIENFLNTVTRENHGDDGTICPPYSLMTGFIGTAWILDALSKCDDPGDAYKMLTSINYPSWLYPVTQGATTVWERLNSYTHKDGFGKNNSMNSFNHYSFGSVGNWLISNSLGIKVNPDNTIIISPEADPTGSIDHASGWLDTKFGKIESSWEIEGNKVIYKVTLPSGCHAIFSHKGKEYQLKPGDNSFSFPL